jgi:hypothetical protein
MNFLLSKKLQRWKGSPGGLRAGEAEMNCRSKVIHSREVGMRDRGAGFQWDGGVLEENVKSRLRNLHSEGTPLLGPTGFEY